MGESRRYLVIQFACLNCAQKLTVKDEFAGRNASCPTCKQPLVVPSGEATMAAAPAGPIDGTPNSIAQAGLDYVALDQTGGLDGDQKPVRDLLAIKAKKGERYILEPLRR